MIERDIWAAFSAAVDSFAAQVSPPLPVLHQGVHGTPPDAGNWLETRFFPNKTRNYGLSDDGPSEHRGFCQISVCSRGGEGIIWTLEFANEAVEFFDKGTLLGQARVESKPYISAVVIATERVSHPVTIPYSARL